MLFEMLGGSKEKRQRYRISAFRRLLLPLSLLLFSSFVTRETSELEKEPESFNTDFQRVLV